MGRFFKTARPDFSQDFIYQPPWELVARAAEMKQVQYDTALTSTSALNDLLKINHIDENIENSNVASEKELWESQIDEITNEIRKTGDYRKLLPRIREVQKGIMQSREDGNISKFENSAAIRDKYLASISKAKKDGGDIASANAAYRTYMDKWLGQENRSVDSVLGYEETISKPKELEGDNIVDIAKKVPSYQNSTFQIDPRGGWIVTTNGKQEFVSKEQLLETVQPYIMSNPNLRPYLDQRQRFGLGEYFNEDGSLIAPYGVKYYDANGNNYSIEDAKKLPEEQQSKLRKEFEFADNSLGQAFKLGTSFEFAKDKSTNKLQIDQARENAIDRKLRIGLQEDRQLHDKDMLALRHKNKLELEAFDKDDLKSELNRLNGFNSFAEIKNKPITDLFKISNNGVFDEAGKSKLDNVFTNLTKGLKGKELKAYKSLQDKILSGEVSTTKQANAHIATTVYPTVNDYIKSQVNVSDKAIELALESKKKQDAVNDKRSWTEARANWLGPTERDIIAANAHYNNYLSKGEDFFAFGIVNESDEKLFKGFKNFSDRTRKYLDDNYNSASIVKEFETVPLANSKAITDIINQNYNDYNFIDIETGEATSSPGEMKMAKGVSGASGRAVSHTMLEGKNGRKYIAIPANNNSPSELAIRNIAIKGLKNDSRVRNELQDFRRGSVMQQFQDAGKSNNFSQEIIIEDVFFNTNSKLKQIGNGVSASYQVVDKDFGTIQTFQDEDTFFNYLEEKSKLQK